MLLYRADSDAHAVSDLGLGSSQRFVPGGLFLGWLIENDGGGSAISTALRDQFLERSLSGPDVFARVGGVLNPDTVAPSILGFATFYVHRSSDGLFEDMAEWFPVPSIFDVRDTWHNYEWMRIRLVERYSQWRASG